MSKFGRLVAALGVGMAGYAKGNQIYNDEQRRQAREAREEEQYQYEKDQRDKARALERDLAASQADQTMGATTDTGATYTDEELIAADNRENRRNAERIGQTAPAPLGVTQYTANGQQYADRGSAQQAMLGVNSQAAKDQRAASVMRQYGQIDKARQYEQFAKQALDEGTDKALSSILGAAPSIDAIKKANGTIDGAVGQDVADVYNKTGGRWKVSPETKVQYYVDKDAAGREVVNARVLGSDGKPLLDNARAATLMLADLKTRLEQQNAETRTYQTGQQITEQGRHNKTVEDIEKRNADTSAARLGIARQELNLQTQKFDLEKDQFKKQSLERQIGEIEKVTGPLAPEDRKNLGIQLAGLGKDDQAFTKFVDSIVSKGVETGAIKPENAVATRSHLIESKKVASQEAAIASDLASSINNPVEYAEKWQKAIRITPPARLEAMGFKPPVARPVNPAPAAAPASNPAPAGLGVRPSPPQVQPWRGGTARASTVAQQVNAQRDLEARIAADPDLNRLESLRRQALAANNAVGANNAAAQIATLRQQRYGL